MAGKCLPIERRFVLTVTELGGVLGRTPGTVRKWLAAGALPKPIMLAGCRCWRRLELEDWLAAGCPPAAHWIWQPSHRYTVEQLIKRRHHELKTLDDEYRAGVAGLAEQAEKLAKGRQALEALHEQRRAVAIKR